jgi:hypothetical protein
VNCRIRIKGELGPSWQAWLGHLQISPQASGTTVLSGYLPDQAAHDAGPIDSLAPGVDSACS